MTTWHIYQLIDYTTGQVKEYEPGDLVHEITNAQARAAEAARLVEVRARLTAIKPTRELFGDGGESLARELFPPPEMVQP